MALKIQSNPVNLTYVNVGQQISFEAVVDSSTSGTSGQGQVTQLFGNEEWIWDFDSEFIPNTADTPGVHTVTYQKEETKTVKVTLKQPNRGTSGYQTFTASRTFSLYKIGQQISSPDYASPNENVQMEVKPGAQSYEWVLNGEKQNVNSPFFSFKTGDKLRFNIKVIITHGNIQKTLYKILNVSLANSVVDKRYLTDNTDNIMFFDKYGNHLNFEYNQTETGRKKWEGELFFDPNSSDTFRSQSLYLFEKVEPIELESQDLFLRRFQLFNEKGMDLIGNNQIEEKQQIEDIFPTINLNGFYTKWIKGSSFHLKFPLGSEVVLEDIKYDNDPDNPNSMQKGNIPDFEPVSTSTAGGMEIKTFTVIDHRLNQIMVISNTHNPDWDYNYDESNPGTIRALNMIRVWKPDEIDKWWNEKGFEFLLYDKKKLSLVNNRENEGVYTVNFYDNNFNKPYAKKYMRINCFNLMDWDASSLNSDERFFSVELFFRKNLVLLSKELIDFIPKSNDVNFNNKNLLVYGFSPVDGDKTPNLLREGQTITFKSNQNIANFNIDYDVLNVGYPHEILEINSNDDDLWILEVNDGQGALNRDQGAIRVYVKNFNTEEEINHFISLDWQEIENISNNVNDLDVEVAKRYYENMVGLKGFFAGWDTGEKQIRLQADVGWDITNVEYLNNIERVLTQRNITFNTNNIKTTRDFRIQKVEGETNGFLQRGWIEQLRFVFTLNENHGIPKFESNRFKFGRIIALTLKNENNNSNDFFIGGLNDDIEETFFADTVYQLTSLGDNKLLFKTNRSGDGNKKTGSINFSGNGIRLTREEFLKPAAKVNEIDSSDTLPEKGFVEGLEVNLDSNTVGFVHFKRSTGTYHIQTGVFSNGKPKWYSVDANQKLVHINPQNKGFGINLVQNARAETYLKDQKLTFTQQWTEPLYNSNDTDNAGRNLLDLSKEKLANNFVNTWAEKFRSFGLDLYVEESKLCVSRIHPLNGKNETDDYIDVKFLQKTSTSMTSGTSIINTLEIPSQTQVFDTYQIEVLENLQTQYLRGWGNLSGQLSEQWTRKIRFDDINPESGLKININGIDYPVPYDDLPTTENNNIDELLDIQETLQDWGNVTFTVEQQAQDDEISTGSGLKYYKQLESIGIITWLERSKENNPIQSSAGGALYNARPFDTLVLHSRYPNINITFDVEGTFEQHKILHSDVIFYKIGNRLTFVINNNNYSVDVSGLTSIEEKILHWKNTFEDSLIEFDIVVEHLSALDNKNSLEFFTKNNDTRFEYTINVGVTPSPGEEFYTVISHRPGNEGLILSGNEVISQSSSIDFQSLGFSTAMIMNIEKAKFPLNNQQYNILLVEPKILGLSYQGAFWNSSEKLGNSWDFINNFNWQDWADPSDKEGTNGNNFTEGFIKLSTKEFLRFPREGYDDSPQITYRFSWLEDNKPQIFFYDFTGKQLEDEGEFTYQGEKPLFLEGQVNLNSEINDNKNKILSSKAQKTVFEDLEFDLFKIDSEVDLTPEPEPLQVFIGFNSQFEGVTSRTLVMDRIDDISFKIKTEPNVKNNAKDLSQDKFNNVVNFLPQINELRVERPTINFNDYYLREGMTIRITGVDNTNRQNQATFENNGLIVEIHTIGVNYLRFKEPNQMKSEKTWKQIQEAQPPYEFVSTGFNLTIEAVPQEIARIQLRGETEVEDFRYKTQLKNLGGDIKPQDFFIYREYNIDEAGIDWTIINRKRKELLSVYPEIFNHIGSYKAVINAINHFGYNDLEFNEYYRNINPDSERFGKLKKVTVPDIFNNQVESFARNDFILDTYPNDNFAKTKLYNLTYKITDFEGNDILAFSVDEIITKLLGLKRWLEEKTIPVGQRILDITGDVSIVEGTSIYNSSYIVTDIGTSQSMTPVKFNVEAYLQPVVNNSETYVVHIIPETKDNIQPDEWFLSIQTFEANPDFKDPEFELNSVQIIKEMRYNLNSYNFTADRNRDPFILIKAITYNGYGSVYTYKKTYSLEKLAFLD